MFNVSFLDGFVSMGMEELKKQFAKESLNIINTIGIRTGYKIKAEIVYNNPFVSIKNK